MNTIMMPIPAPPPSSRRLRPVAVHDLEDKTLLMGGAQLNRPTVARLPRAYAGKFASTQRIDATPLPAMLEAPMEATAAKEHAEATPKAESAPKVDVTKLQKLLVTAYRFAGFAILTCILLGLASYLAINAFFFTNHGWVLPTVLSPSDERVLRLEALYSQESAAKSALVAERLQLEARVKDADRIAVVEDTFQEGFRLAMEGDLEDRQSGLAKFRSLLGHYAVTKAEIQKSSGAFSSMSRGNLQQEFDAHVIDKDQMVTGNLQLAQLAGSNLALSERHVELDARVSALRREVDSLRIAQRDAADGKPTKGQLSYDVLRIKHEFDKSVLEAAKAKDEAAALRESVEGLQVTIAEHDKLMQTIRRSPYVMAADHDVTVAFIPYDNKDGVEVGSPVYGCYASIVFCKKIGQVAEVLDGEIVEKHPLHNKELRGIAARLELDDPHWVEHPVLHVGRKPILL